jgi:lipoprotein-releasing system permease protein
LGLLDQNVTVFLGLILIVACFNMVSILLILIMERTNMIGTLTSLGASTNQIKKIFTYHGMQLIVKGLVIGNALALLIAFIQDKIKIIPLDPANSYMDFVPIEWDIQSLIWLNLLTFVIVSLALGIPLSVLSRIKTISAIKFD